MAARVAKTFQHSRPLNVSNVLQVSLIRCSIINLLELFYTVPPIESFAVALSRHTTGKKKVEELESNIGLFVSFD